MAPREGTLAPLPTAKAPGTTTSTRCPQVVLVGLVRRGVERHDEAPKTTVEPASDQQQNMESAHAHTTHAPCQSGLLQLRGHPHGRNLLGPLVLRMQRPSLHHQRWRTCKEESARKRTKVGNEDNNKKALETLCEAPESYEVCHTRAREYTLINFQATGTPPARTSSAQRQSESSCSGWTHISMPGLLVGYAAA
jgi:hypothetical protein